MNEDKKLHSELYFNELRDYWWNRDFLVLMAERWNLESVQSVLDVGCGQGHWGRALLPLFKKKIKLIGIDPEPKWIESSTVNAEPFRKVHELSYQRGTAESLPFEDNVFHMVTCQTVLIHVKDPMVALTEMVRVLRPGGLLVVAEPDNAVPMITIDNVKKDVSVEDRIKMLRLQLICEKGKEALGEGNNMRGDLVPYYFFKTGLSDIQSYLSDMADFYVPPYSSPRQCAGIEIMISEIEKGNHVWEMEETRRYFIAGGGSDHDFTEAWDLIARHNQALVRAIKDKKLCLPGGTLFYLTSARKPSS